MNSLRSIFSKNLSLINFLVIFFFFIYSILIIRYQYDGHHIGLIYSNSLDFINGKKPYKEIFIQYGILTTIINSLILTVFDNKIFFINFFNSIFYSLGILIISKTIKNLTNLNLSFLATTIILFNHPIPWLPWPNYIAFFFISIGMYLISINRKNFFLIGIFFGLSILCRQELFIPIVISLVMYGIINFFFKIPFKFKKIILFIMGFTFPLFVFLIYLILSGLINYWIAYLQLPAIYLETYDTNLVNLILNFVIFFSTESFFSFIIFPQYFVISIILIFNTIILFLFLFKKIKINKEILFILIVGILSSALALKIELFRLYTSVIFGLIPLLYFIDKIRNKDLRKKMFLSLFLPSIFSICFYPMGNNDLFKNINFVSSNLKVENEKFNYTVIPEQKIKIINLINNLSNKCDVTYLENLTWDTIYSTITNNNRIRVMPYAHFKKSNYKQVDLIENIKNPNSSFINLINREIKRSNIILLITNNNNYYKNDKLEIGSNYKMIEIDETNIRGRPQILRIYYPTKCNI